MFYSPIFCFFIFVVSVNTEESIVGEYFPGVQNLFGDLIVGEKLDTDLVLYSNIYVNEKEAFDQTVVLLIDVTDYVINHIRAFNIGRHLAAVNNYTSIVDKKGRKKLEIKFSVKELEQPRLVVELYGKSGTSILFLSYLLLLMPNIMFNYLF